MLDRASLRSARPTDLRTVQVVGIIPSASYSITVRLEVPSEGLPPSLLTSAVESVGGMVTAFDVTAARATACRST